MKIISNTVLFMAVIFGFILACSDAPTLMY